MMASALKRGFVDRAMKAEQLLEIVKSRLVQLKEAAVAKACEEELKVLSAENERLKEQVEGLVLKLSQAEELNGVPQTGTAKAPAVTSCKPVSGSGEVEVEARKQESATKQKPRKEKSAKKQPPADGKPKTKKEPAASMDSLPVNVSRLLLKVGKIVDVKKHEDADGLYVETVDLAEPSPRTIVSGLVKHVPIEEMQDRLAVFACNLKPAKMRGVLSQGMIMCASSPEVLKIVQVPEGSVPGDVITFADYPGEADQQLNPKKKIWESIAPDLKTDENGVATYKGCPFTIVGKGVCTAPDCANFAIK